MTGCQPVSGEEHAQLLRGRKALVEGRGVPLKLIAVLAGVHLVLNRDDEWRRPTRDAEIRFARPLSSDRYLGNFPTVQVYRGDGPKLRGRTAQHVHHERFEEQVAVAVR